MSEDGKTLGIHTDNRADRKEKWRKPNKSRSSTEKSYDDSHDAAELEAFAKLTLGKFQSLLGEEREVESKKKQKQRQKKNRTTQEAVDLDLLIVLDAALIKQF